MKGNDKRRYAVVGCGGRGIYMYALPIVERFPDVAELVGICDINTRRMDFLKELIKQDLPSFTDFRSMLNQVKPDTVIIATVDRLHHRFIIGALESGCDAITEKPMTIDDEKCRAILDAEHRTGKNVTAMFNYRFTPYALKIKELLAVDSLVKYFQWTFPGYLTQSTGQIIFAGGTD